MGVETDGFQGVCVLQKSHAVFHVLPAGPSVGREPDRPGEGILCLPFMAPGRVGQSAGWIGRIGTRRLPGLISVGFSKNWSRAGWASAGPRRRPPHPAASLAERLGSFQKPPPPGRRVYVTEQ